MEIIYIVLDWILFRAICISQRYLSPKSRNENKNFQMTMSKALAKSTEVITIVLLSLLETSIISQRSLSLPSMPNNLLFIWEPVDLITLWHAPLKMKEENIYKTICFESSENFWFQRGVIFIGRVQRINGENIKLYNLSIVNNIKYVSMDSIRTKG